MSFEVTFMKLKKYGLIVLGVALLCSCEDSTSTEAPFHSNIDETAKKVNTIYSLGACTSEQKDRTVWVEQEQVNYVCKNNEWKISSSEKKESSKIVYGTLKDSRDGHKYKTVEIGSQVWMAENLNYMNDSIYSACLPAEFGGCEKYGRSYIWHSAMELVSKASSSSTEPSELSMYIQRVHQGVCPEGWHIPTDTEWKSLIDYVETHNGNEFAGTSLKSNKWETMEGLPQGTDRFGFSAIQTGNTYIDKRGVQFNGSYKRAVITASPNIRDNNSGEREEYIGGKASFCSTSGNIWYLANDEFVYNEPKFSQYKCVCSVRCLKD